MKKIKSKYFVFKVSLCVVLLILDWAGFALYQGQLRDKKKYKKIVQDDYTYVFQIDEFKKLKNDVVLNGWVFELKKSAEKGQFKVLLGDMEKEKVINSEVEYYIRDDVNRYFSCEYDYSLSGFKAVFNLENIKFEKGIYEILIEDTKKDKVIKTGVYLNKDGLAYSDPRQFKDLEVENTDLEEIVSNGVLRVYRDDIGMYIYQYDGRLYWIADNKYNFDEGGKTEIQFQMYTTQIQKLPKERLENKWYWSNITFFFENNECNINAGRYRVSMCPLPTEYSITDIWTGKCDTMWEWKERFRPWYEFDSINDNK